MNLNMPGNNPWIGKMKKVKVIILRTAGTNCDEETAFAFKNFGASVDMVHIKKLFEGKVKLKDYHILAIPGGFTYGDDIESGRILANELNSRLGDDIKKFVKDGKLIIGICNGFQVLIKSGILPGESGQSATLTFNDSGKFEDRWSHLTVEGKGPWLEGIDETVYFPVAHAEGKFVTEDNNILEKLKANNQIAFRYSSGNGSQAKYPDNPNGSVENIAGITDSTGRVLGLMPHPERHFLFVHHPQWTRFEKKEKYGHGAQIFKNGVEYVKKNLING